MAILPIVCIPDPILRETSTPVETFDADLKTLIADMFETMYDAPGIGLAAIQVYEPIRICAVEIRNNPRYPYKPPIPLTVLVNPVLEQLWVRLRRQFIDRAISATALLLAVRPAAAADGMFVSLNGSLTPGVPATLPRPTWS